jgi:Family of unknown function (DUF6088)
MTKQAGLDGEDQRFPRARDRTITRSSLEITLVTAIQEDTLLAAQAQAHDERPKQDAVQAHPFLLAFCQKKIQHYLTMRAADASTPDRIMKQVRATGRGGVFTPSDFLDLASRAAIDQALSRLVKSRKLRRLVRGLYDFPKVHPQLGPLSPAPDDVAHALARESGSRVQITGARAANELGLSAQVVAKSIYLTDGPSRCVVLGRRVIDLRHASPKHLIAPGSLAGTVVQALRHIGPARADELAQIAASHLSPNDKKTLASAAVQAPAWMRSTLLSIADPAAVGTISDR